MTVFLNAGETLNFGTCPGSVDGANDNGTDTWIRLYDPMGAEVAQNDHDCHGVGDENGSFISYRALVDGNYEMRAGCHDIGHYEPCSGVVGYEIEP